MKNVRQIRIINERMDDVKHLREAYNECTGRLTNRPNVEALIAVLAGEGVKLHNPIAKDPTKPCYTLVWNSDYPTIAPKIVETNVKSDQLVISDSDGSRFLMPHTSP